MNTKLAEIEVEHAKAIAGGGEKYIERHHKRGKLLARERIELLLDEDSPFLELCPLAAWGSDFPVGASTVVGYRRRRGCRMPDRRQRSRRCAAAPAIRGRCGRGSAPTTSPCRTACR